MTTHGISSPPLHSPGHVVNNRYTILRGLGRGAMGQVFLVDDAQHRRQVAMKYLLQPARETLLQQFKKEFDTLAHLRHPHITTVYDLDRDQENNTPFFTSEFITGLPFDAAVRELPQETVLHLFVQTLRALAYLHGHGIRHFDIKAHNVLVQIAAGATPSVKLIDFGLATTLWRGKRMGTPSYMAPEMIAMAAAADGRADLYSLGVLLYSALTRSNPFRADTIAETYRRHQELIPQAPSACQPHLPAYLDHVVMQLLEKDPANRFANATEVILALNRLGPTTYAIETDDTLRAYVPSAGPFVGRMAERSRLQQCLAQGSAHLPVCWITGESGVGKSRLLHEAKSMAQIADMHTCLVDPQDGRHPLDVAKLLDRIADDPDRWWIGIDHGDVLMTDPQWSHVSVALRTLLQQLTIRHRLNDRESVPQYVVCCTATPSTRTRLESAWCNLGHPTTTIALAPFSREELLLLVSTVTGLSDPPPSLSDQLQRYTGGHPLFVIETLKGLIRNGLLFDPSGRWRDTTFADLDVDISRLHIPATIESVVAQQYARLTEPAQRVLGLLAVANLPLTHHAMAELLGATAPDDLLKSLLHDHLLVCDGATQTYRCATAALQQGVYRQLGTRARQQWHDTVARWLAADPAADPSLVALHRSRGSDAALAQKARWDLAQYYLETHRAAAAIAVLQPDAASDDGPHQCAVHHLLGQAHVRLRQFDDAIAAFRRALQVMPPDTERHWHPELREAWGHAAMRARRYADAESQYRQVIDLMQREQIDDPVRVLRLTNAIAQTRLYRANTPDALHEVVRTFRQTADRATRLPVRERAGITNNDLGHALMQQGLPEEAVVVLQQDVEFFRQIAQPRQEMRAMGLLAECHRLLHRYAEALTHCEAAIAIARSLHDPAPLMHHYTTMANLHADQQHYDRAITWYERALDLAPRVGDMSRTMAITLNLGDLHFRTRQMRRARHHLESTIAFADSRRAVDGLDNYYGCKAHLLLAEVHRGEQHFGVAHRHIREARAIAAQYPNCRPLLFWIVATQIEIHRDEGSLDAARGLTRELQQLANTDGLRETMQTLEESLHS